MSFDAELRDVLVPSPVPQGWAASSRRLGEACVAMPPGVARSRTRHPYIKAFVCAGVTYLAATGLLLAVAFNRILSHATSQELGDAMAGAMTVSSLACIVPAVATGMIVSQSPRVWPIWQIALVFLPMFLLAMALQVLGAVTG